MNCIQNQKLRHVTSWTLIILTIIVTILLLVSICLGILLWYGSEYYPMKLYFQNYSRIMQNVKHYDLILLQWITNFFKLYTKIKITAEKGKEIKDRQREIEYSRGISKVRSLEIQHGVNGKIHQEGEDQDKHHIPTEPFEELLSLRDAAFPLS